MLYDKIRSIRISKGFTQQSIADKLYITRQQYHLYESGKREIPAHLLKEICKIFGTTSDYLIDVEYNDIEFNFDKSFGEIKDDFTYLYNLLDLPEFADNDEIIRTITRAKNTIECLKLELGYIRSKQEQ